MYPMKTKAIHSLMICLLLMVTHQNHVHAVTDAELEALEKQIDQQEVKEKKQAEAEAKRKAEEKRHKAEQKRKNEIKRKAEEEKRRQHEVELDKQKQQEEQKRLADKRLAEKQRQQENANRLRQAEIERKIGASLTDFTNRSAVKNDQLGYVDNVTKQDLSQNGTKQISTTISATIQEWQNSGVEIKRGNTYKISASGQWSIGPFCNPTGPSGDGAYTITCWDNKNKIVANRSHAALIGKIGKHTLAFYIGSEFTFTANKDGTLYMMCNDGPGWFFDNSGEVSVTINLVQ